MGATETCGVSQPASSLKGANSLQRAMISLRQRLRYQVRARSFILAGEGAPRCSHAVRRWAQKFRWDCPARSAKDPPEGNVCWAWPDSMSSISGTCPSTASPMAYRVCCTDLLSVARKHAQQNLPDLSPQRRERQTSATHNSSCARTAVPNKRSVASGSVVSES